ncbi:disulfide bond corrector protein DsbC [compost metagenome]
MRKILILVALMFGAHISIAQGPMKWAFSTKKISEKVFDVHFTAAIDTGWFMYSQFNPKMGGPTPTTFKFMDNPDFIIDKEKLKEDGVMEEKYDSAFSMELKYYRSKVDFVKRITLKEAAKTSVSGTVTFMGCNEQMCLPPQEVEFKIELK